MFMLISKATLIRAPDRVRALAIGLPQATSNAKPH
jgi:hypothetical protein